MRTTQYESLRLGHHELPQTPPAVGCWLWVCDAGVGWWYELVHDVVHLGRSSSADVPFEHASVSRRHALLHRLDGEWWICDDRALNPVRVDGEPIVGRHRLRPGALVEMGASHMWLVERDD